MSHNFKAKPQHLVPEVLAIALTGCLTYALRLSKPAIQTITLFPETLSGVTLNAALFVILVAAVGTGMYLCVKFGLKRLLKYLIKTALFMMLLFLFIWLGVTYSAYLPPQLAMVDGVWLLISLAGAVVLSAGIYKAKGPIHLASTILISGLAGTFLGVSIPLLTAITLLLALSAYDLFAVYKGPIGRIAERANLEELSGAVFTYRELTIGMGDMVFYSMLASASMMNFGPIPFFGAAIGLVAGAFLGFKMLEGRDMFPGLPIAITLGAALTFLVNQALMALNPI